VRLAITSAALGGVLRESVCSGIYVLSLLFSGAAGFTIAVGSCSPGSSRFISGSSFRGGSLPWSSLELLGGSMCEVLRSPPARNWPSSRSRSFRFCLRP
jgi:hypothetical protein